MSSDQLVEAIESLGEKPNTRSGPLGRHVLPDPPYQETQLAPASTPLRKLVGVTLITLFWNGIVSIFVVAFFQGAGTLLGLFLIPFVLVGLLLILATVHSILALFNAQPVVTVDSPVVSVGDTVSIGVRLKGRADRVQKLKLVLRCVEWVQYRRGTDITTDEETLLEMPVLEFDNPRYSGSSRQDVTIPTDAMHSFKARCNRIAWVIHVDGEIPRWPDIDIDFPLHVVPRSVDPRTLAS